MARFTKFQLLFVLKWNFNGVNFKRYNKIWLFQEVGKSQNKVAVAEEIGCINVIVLSKNYEAISIEKSLVLDGWVDGLVGGWV